jgi:hypothetical protein
MMDLKEKMLNEIKDKSEYIFEYGFVGDYIKIDKLKDILDKYVKGGMTLKEPMKLFQVDVMDDCESETVLTIAKTSEQAEEKVSNEDWSCFMGCTAFEINEVDGYKIILEKKNK